MTNLATRRTAPVRARNDQPARLSVLRFVRLMIAVAVVATSPAIDAAAVPLPAGPFTLGAGLWQWDSFSNNGGDFIAFDGLGNSFVLDDARYNGRADAYDGAFELLVFGPEGFRVPSGIVDVSGSAASGFSLDTPSVAIGPINVSESYFLFANAPIVRALYRFDNPTAAPIAVYAAWHQNLGSDSNTLIETTQDGDTLLEQTDRTFVTSDGNPLGDPVLGWVRYGADSPLLPTVEEIPGPGNGFFRDAYALTLQANSTSYLLFYGVLGDTVGSVSGLLQFFDSNDTMQAAHLFNGLSDATLARVANYNIAPIVVAEPGALALLAVALLALAHKTGAGRRVTDPARARL